MSRNILQRIRKSKGGFTLVELMVTMVLVGLLVGASAAGIFYYQKWAVWQRQEHYAKTLFLAAQSGMTQYSADKRLEEFEEKAKESTQAIVRQNELLIPVTDENGQTVSVSEIWKNNGGQDASDLYYVIGTPTDYQAYKSGGADEAHTLLYDIFDAYLYDKTLLSNGCVSVEFDAHDGLVYSVLYSDRADELAYGSCTSTTANILNRSKSNRKGNGSENSTGLCFGYYGADSLSKSNDSSSAVKISTVSLNNEETLNLTWKLSADEAVVSQMSYQVMICDAKTGEELLELSINDSSLRGQKSEEGYYYSIPSETAEDALKLVAAEVTSFADGKQTKLGTYPFFAYIDENLQVTLVLDAVDLDATQAAYETYRRTKDAGNLSDTLSFHRFGLEQYGVDEITCIVQGGGNGYRITGRKQSNSEPMYFAKNESLNKDLTESDDSSLDTNRQIYEIQNARHLYNIRFSELVSDAAVYTADANERTGNDYVITKDFAWGYSNENADEKVDEEQEKPTSILKNGNVYRSGVSVKAADTAFPMITQLREGSSLGSSDADEVHTIDFLTISDTENEGIGSSNRFYPQGDGTALFLENLGKIHDLSLQHVSVLGSDYTAAFCAYNGGTLENLETSGRIEARNYVSGVFAASLPLKESDEFELTKLVNHAVIKASETAAGIVAQSSDAITLTDCVNTGVITGNTVAGITTVQSEELTLVRCQNYGTITSTDEDDYGITNSLTAKLIDCVGVSKATYPIASDASEDKNCWYFVAGEESLEDAVKGGIADISLTIGEQDRNGAYKEKAFTEATDEQIQHLIKQDSTDVPVFDSSVFDTEECICPIYTVRFQGICKPSNIAFTWLGKGEYQFDIWYADAQDGNWKMLIAGCQATGEDANTTVKVPESVEASALKIVVTDATADCDVSLGGISLEGSWRTAGIAMKKDSSESVLDTDEKKDEEQLKTEGIGTVLYVRQEDELTEEKQADLYTKWMVPVGSLSISPLLLDTEEAKNDEADENIRIRVWKKLRDELTDLSMFDVEKSIPGTPSGIGVTEFGDTMKVIWQPGLFAESYEYEVEYFAYERDTDQNPIQEEDGSFKTLLIGNENGETKETTLDFSSSLDGQHVDRMVFRIRSVNELGSSEWVAIQTADERIKLPELRYHLALSGSNLRNTDTANEVGYEIVIENKDEYETLVADHKDQLTVQVNGDAKTQFSLDKEGRIWILDEESITISCRILCPGYQTSNESEKTFSVLNSQTVFGNQAVFDATLKPDQKRIGFQKEDASVYQIEVGASKKTKMQILAALETKDETLSVPVQYQATKEICSSDTMETIAFAVESFYQEDQFAESAFLAYPISLDNGQVELGHMVGDIWSAQELLGVNVTEDGNVAQDFDASAYPLIDSGKLADGYAIFAVDGGYELYYSPLLKNRTLSQYSSSEQSLYGIWRYELTEEERNVKQPEETSSEEESSSEEPTSEEESSSEEPTSEEESSSEELTSEEESSSEEPTSEEESSSEELTSETETEPEPEKLDTPELISSDEKQEFLYPVFDKDENGNWKDSGRKATALQRSVYFDVDADEEGCAGYEVSMISLPKTKQIGRESVSYRDAFTFQIVKDDSEAGFHISGMLSTKSTGYTMKETDKEGGFVDLYEMYTDRQNGVYTYLLPYYVECESEQEKVLVYAWLKQTNKEDETGNAYTRFELFLTENAAPLGESYMAESDCAVISAQALAEENQMESYGREKWLDSNVGSINRSSGSESFQKNESEKEETNDSFADAQVEESHNTGFAYAFSVGAGTNEYLIQTRQWRVTRNGEKTCTYRILPVYWKYDEQGITKQYVVELPEDGFAVLYYEQVNGNEPYLLYDLSICFANMDQNGLSSWSKQSASAHDGDPKTFVLYGNSGLGHLTTPVYTSSSEDGNGNYPLLDQNGQEIAQIRAKTRKLSWNWNADWDKLAGFETTLSFMDQTGQMMDVRFDWNLEEWIKDPSAWDSMYGKNLINRLSVYEKKEEFSSEEFFSSEEDLQSTTESQTEPTTESQTPQPTIESQTEPITESQTPQPTIESQTESTTESQPPQTSEVLPETQSINLEIEETISEEAPAPVSDEASIQRKMITLRAASPFINKKESTQNQLAYTLEIQAVLTIQTTVLSDGSTEYQFTIEIPTEVEDAQYTDANGEQIVLMQLAKAQTILKLQDADCWYYEEPTMEMQP